MAAFFIHRVTLFLILVGERNPYLGRDAFLGVSVFLSYWTPHLSCVWIAYNIAE